MKKSEFIERLLCSTVLSGAMLFAGPAFAQTEVTADEDDVELEEVDERMTVTGSRIVGANVTAASPILSVDPGDLDSRGTVLVEDFLNVLPQVFVGQTSDVSNGASGTATVNLRGLGAVRTLPLIDGKRLPFGSPTFSPANIDLVPTQLVERIDVVTGGASAVYGSDAVAGVVNFILRDDFEGLEIDVQGSFFVDQNDNDFAQGLLSAAEQPIPGTTLDGFGTAVSAIFGANTSDDRGNVTLFFQYLRQGQQIGADHDVGACTIGGTGPDGFGCVGSSNFRRVNPNIPAADAGAGLFFQNDTGALIPFTGGPAQTFNFGAFNFFQRPVERFTIYGKAHYEITDNIRGYLDVEFQNNSTDAQIAPSASFNRGFEINCDNPLINSGIDPNIPESVSYFDILGCAGDEDGLVPFIHSHRNVEGDPRVSIFDVATFRIVGGIDGAFLEDKFTYDLFGQFSQVSLDDISIGDISFDNAQQALLLQNNPETGALECIDPSGGCVPWNILTRGADGSTNVTPEAAAFVQGVGITVGTVEQVVIGGTIQTNLADFGVTSPFAQDGATILGGFEFRSDNLESVPDVISQTPFGEGLTGVGGATLPVQGEVRVAEAFMEVNIPIIQDVFLIEDFAINGAYRRSMYTVDDLNGFTNDFDTNTFHAGITWQVVEDIRFRAQFQRAVRAPNVIELFEGEDTGLFDLPALPNGLADPCAGDFDPNTPDPEPFASFEQCANTGVTAEQFGTILDAASGQFNSITGGNPELLPESSDTITAGITITPRWVPNLTIAIDYFNIEVSDFINSIPPAFTVFECLETGNPEFCNLINRDAIGSLAILAQDAEGNAAGVFAGLVNIAEFSTDGIDFNIQYSYDLSDAFGPDLGGLVFSYASTYLRSLEFTAIAGGESIDCVGRVLDGCTGAGSPVGVPSPAYRHFTSLTWQTPVNVDLRLNWRYFGSAESIDTPNALVGGEFEAQNYLDLSLFWDVHEDVTFRLGVNNVLDNDPPLTTAAGTGTGNNNTFPGVYDATGRFFFMGVTFTR